MYIEGVGVSWARISFSFLSFFLFFSFIVFLHSSPVSYLRIAVAETVEHGRYVTFPPNVPFLFSFSHISLPLIWTWKEGLDRIG